MTYDIRGVEAISAGTTAVDVNVRGRTFIIKNASANAVYFKEKLGVACTADNGFMLSAGETLDLSLCADVLSIVAAADSSSVRILYLV